MTMSYLCPHCNTRTVLLDDGNGLCCGRDPKVTPEEYQKRKGLQEEVMGDIQSHGGDKIYRFLRKLENI